VGSLTQRAADFVIISPAGEPLNNLVNAVQEAGDLAVGERPLTVEALRVDLQRDVHGVPRPLRNLSCRYAGRQPGGHRRVPQVVRIDSGQVQVSVDLSVLSVHADLLFLGIWLHKVYIPVDVAAHEDRCSISCLQSVSDLLVIAGECVSNPSGHR